MQGFTERTGGDLWPSRRRYQKKIWLKTCTVFRTVGVQGYKCLQSSHWTVDNADKNVYILYIFVAFCNQATWKDGCTNLFCTPIGKLIE